MSLWCRRAVSMEIGCHRLPVVVSACESIDNFFQKVISWGHDPFVDIFSLFTNMINRPFELFENS